MGVVSASATTSALHIPGVISSTVGDGPNKLFLGGLPAYLNDDHVKELLQAFGELRVATFTALVALSVIQPRKRQFDRGLERLCIL